MIQLKLEKKLSAANGIMNLTIDTTIQKGELIAIYGESGAGKTSILRMLAGLLTPDKGTIIVNNHTWFTTKKTHLKPQDRKIGFVFQDFALFPNMSVRENLLFALDKGQNTNIVEELINVIELTELQHAKPNQLSGGQKQRVALARALVQKPEILLLDEPLSGLDNTMRSKLQSYLLLIHKKYSLTTIIVSHSPSEIVKLCNRVLVLKNGKIANEGTPLDIFNKNTSTSNFEFTSEVLKIEKESNNHFITIAIGINFTKIQIDTAIAEKLQVGDKITINSKAFEPRLQKN